MDISVILVFVLLIGLILLRAPVAFALGMSGLVGILMDLTPAQAVDTLATLPYTASAKYGLILLPMFILMGMLVSHAGLVAGVFDLAHRLTRRLPGGLGLSTVLACGFMGGISGSSVADSATIGRLAVGEMAKRGYEKAFAAALVAAAGTVAILIPPSIVLVVYGSMTGESVGQLLLAGVVPGVLSILATMLVVVWSHYRGTAYADGRAGHAQRAAAAVETHQWSTPLRTRLFGIIGGTSLFVIVVGGIYTGIFSATESGAVGVGAAFFLATLYVLTSPRGELSRPRRVVTMLGGALRESGNVTAMVFALLIGASVFTHYLVISQIPTDFASWVLELDVHPGVVVALFLLLLIPLGAFVDGLSLLLIVAPIAYPVITALGYDGIWFGILMVKCIEIGLLTPPVGLNIYVVSGLYPDLKVERIFKRVMPFIVMDLLLTCLLFTFPDLVTWLASQVAS